MNAWLNVIYKMMADGCSNELIYFYIKRQKAFHESERNLADYIYLIGKKFSRQNPVQCKNGYGMGVTTWSNNNHQDRFTQIYSDL